VRHPGTSTRFLHVHNGDASRATLQRTAIAGEHTVWAEALHEGPVRGREPREVWREERVRFYASLGPPPQGYPPAAEQLARWDAGLARHAEFDEVILWFEHDLFDQLCLIHHLNYYAHRDLAETLLSLVCIGAFPGIARFLGLGQLSPDQLASLLDTRQGVSEEQTALGRRAWNALSDETPAGVAALLGEDTSPLPFLAPGLRRLLEEFPSPREGLPRTEHQVLARLTTGPASGADLFHHNQTCEERPFMGDLLFWRVLERLAGGDHPLLTLDPAGVPHAQRTATLTADGGRVVRGEADAVALNGIDLWRGGVHLRGREDVWRWDAAGDTLLRR
jgi:hypothetical protein